MASLVFNHMSLHGQWNNDVFIQCIELNLYHKILIQNHNIKITK